MIREPSVAGHFYPGSASVLQDSIQTYLTTPATRYRAKAVVAPHAGYIYSGAVAGEVYSSVEIPKRFIILGPNHTGMGVPLSLHPPGQWRTPLALATVDEELTQRLEREHPALQQDRRAHAREHSVEVQIPFLQVLEPDMRFAAICVGTGDLSALSDLGHSIARVVQSSPEPILLIASSDMNHYEHADVSKKKDRAAIDRVLALDPEGLYHEVQEKDISMCGFAPTVAVLTACQDLGAARGHLVRYANSGDVSGDYGHVVGYAGMVIV